MAVAVSLRFSQSSYPSSQSSPWYYISNYINCRRFVFHRHLRYYRILSLISIAFALASDRSHYLFYYVFEIYFSMILISIFIYLKGTLISAFSLILQYVLFQSRFVFYSNHIGQCLANFNIRLTFNNKSNIYNESNCWSTLCFLVCFN